MIVTAGTFTPFSTSASQHCIGELQEMTMTFTLSQVVNAYYIQLHLQLAQYIQAGSILDPSTPTVPRFYARFNNTFTANNYLPMTWTDTDNNRHLRAEWKYQIVGTTTVLTFRFYGFVAQDFTNYQNNVLVNHDRLLRNMLGATSDNSNTSSPAIYNTSKSLHFCLYVFEEPTPVIPAGLWSRGVYDTPPEEYVFWNEDATRIVSHVFKLTNSNAATSELSIYEDIELKFNFETIAGATVNKVYIGLLSNSAQNNTQFWTANYGLSYSDEVGGTPAGYEIPNAAFGATALTNPSPDNYVLATTIQAAFVDNSSTYRLFAVVDLTSGGNRYFVPLLSDVVTGAEPPVLSPPDAVGTISDYLKQYGEWLQCTPQERLQMCVNYSGLPFNVDASAITAATFPSLINSIVITLYSIDGNFKNVYEEYNIARSGANFISNSDVQILEDVGTSTLTVCLLRRLRYENTPCLYSIDINTNTVASLPQTTMEFAGKQIYVEFQLRGNFTDYNNINYNYNTVKYLLLDVKQYDTTVQTITFDQTSLCANDAQLGVQVTKTDAGDDYLIIGIDKEPYSIANFEENEFFSGILPQLTTPKVLSADDQFSANVANAVLDLSYFQMGQQYRFAAIKKPVVFPCDAAANSGGGAFTTLPITLGAGTGNVYLLTNAYGITVNGTAGSPLLYDNFEYVWDGITQINTGFVFGHGLNVFNKTNALPNDGTINVTGGSASTGWWLLSTCPSPSYLPCPLNVLADPSQVFQFGTQQLFNQFFACDLGAALGTVNIDYILNANGQAQEGYYITAWVLDGGVPTFVAGTYPAYGMTGTGGFVGGFSAGSILRGGGTDTISFIKTATMGNEVFIIVTRWSADVGTPDFDITVNCPI